MDQAGIRFDFDGSSFIGQAGKMTDAVQNVVKAGVQGGQALEASWEQTMRFVMQATDKQEQANKRLVLSMEMRNATYGQEMTEVQRLIAQRDEYNKRLQGSEEWLKRNNAAFAGMISKAEEAAKGAQFKEFGENIAKFVEQPMMAGRGAITGFLETLGPMGGLAAGSAATLAALAASVYESTKAFGEAGLKVRDTELRMGVTAKQAAELGFAAKAAGADASVFERAMRGLTNAVEGTGSEGAKASAELRHFGVDVDGLKNGTAGTYETLIKISDGLASIPIPIKRTAEGMDIFKKAWNEMAPAMLDLRENSEYWKSHKLPSWTEDDVKKAELVSRQLQAIDERLTHIKNVVDGGVANFFVGILGGGPVMEPGSMGRDIVADMQRRAAADRNAEAVQPYLVSRDRQLAAFGNTEEGSRDLLEDAKKKESAARSDLFADNSDTLVAVAQKHAQAWKKATAELTAYQAKYDQIKEAEELHKRLGQFGIQDANASLWEREINKSPQERNREFDRSSQDDFKSAVEAWRKVGESILKASTSQLKTETFGREADLSAQESAIRIRGGDDQDRQLMIAKKSSLDDIYGYQLQKVLKNEDYITDADEQRNELQMQHARDVNSLELKLTEQMAQKMREETLKISTDDLKASRFGREADLSVQESSIRVNGILGGRDQSVNMDRQLMAAKKAALDDIYGYELQKIQKNEAYTNDSDAQRRELQMQHARDVADLQMKLAEQVAQETRKQFDTIKASATSLWETALTHPGKFGAQLRTTMHEAIIKPVAEGLGGLTAQVLQPVIYGSDGHSGIAGMFKGTFGGFDKPIDPLKPALDSNAMATRQLTGEIANLGSEFRTARNFGGGGGNGGSGSWGGGGISGILPWSFAAQRPTASAPGSGYSSGGWGTNIFNPDFGGGASMYGGGGYGGFGSSGAPGGTSGFDGPVFQTGATAAMPRSNNPFAGLFGGGGGGGGAHSGLAGIAGGLKGGLTGLESSIGYHGAQGWTTGPGSSFSTVAGSIATSPAVGTAGMMIAEKGIFGPKRGTWGGVGESTAGGAMVGAQYGGAVGAGIGAIVGFGIGLGEMASGDISPQEKAKRLCKSIYGVNIDNQMVNQIVSMAQSKYANNIEMTVRSPEVRQMMGVYAAGTGQKMPLSASTPMGGSLAEQGGQLYQQASYQYGKSYSYGGNLPVLGGPTQGTIPNASQPLSMALNIQGQDMQSFMQGNVVTPEAIQNGMEAAWNAGNGRVSGSAAMMGVPNLIT